MPSDTASSQRSLLALVALVVLGCGPRETVSAEERARALHRDAIVVDTHADTTFRFGDPGWRFDERHPVTDSRVDLPRIREGGLDVEFWSIYTGAGSQPGEAIRIALQRIDSVQRMIERHASETALATSAREIRQLVAERKLASLMGVEGGHMIEDDLAVLRTFYRLGVRYMTLTHSFHTSWADSAGMLAVPEPVHGGLTAFGEEVVREMNRLGMMVDVSHVSDDTFFDAIRVSRAPVIASHSACRAVAAHARNLSDEMLRELAANGGVVMINFYPGYIDEDTTREMQAWFAQAKPVFDEIESEHPGDLEAQQRARRAHLAAHPAPQTDLAVLLDHFDHALRVAGPDHVGIGADWDGVPSMPRGLEDVSALPRLTQALLERGHDEETVRKVLGENLLRVMAQVEEVARSLRASP